MKMKVMMTKTKMMKWVPMLALLRTILRMRNDFNDGMGWLHGFWGGMKHENEQ
jgi:hypothetical protein